MTVTNNILCTLQFYSLSVLIQKAHILRLTGHLEINMLCVVQIGNK